MHMYILFNKDLAALGTLNFDSKLTHALTY